MRDRSRRFGADSGRVGLIARHPLPAAICAAAIALTAGFFVFARPQYRPPYRGPTITLPEKQPAADASGRAGWVWPDGVPGWEPGYSIKGFNVSQIQRIEAQPAQLAAAYAGLDAERVRVLEAQHVWPGMGPLAVFAAPMLEATPAIVCFAAALPRVAPIEWHCPGAARPAGDLANARVLVASVARRWPRVGGQAQVGFNLVGVARGDVSRVVLHIPHQSKIADWPLYDRGKTWGQFSAAFVEEGSVKTPELKIYDRHGLTQTLRLDVKPGRQRVNG
jgi:hypothetical protein